MELIRHIKEAEAKANETVTQAKADAVKLAEQTDTKQAEMLERAQQERSSAITQAVAEAEKDTMAEVEKLREDGRQQKKDLQAHVIKRMDASVDKVMHLLRD